MTNEDLNKLEQHLRQHKERGQSSNVTLKINQLEDLIKAARVGLEKADVVDFNIAAQIRREDVQERRYSQRWADAARQERFEKEASDRLQKRRQRREERRQDLLSKWKTYAGYQKSQILK